MAALVTGALLTFLWFLNSIFSYLQLPSRAHCCHPLSLSLLFLCFLCFFPHFILYFLCCTSRRCCWSFTVYPLCSHGSGSVPCLCRPSPSLLLSLTLLSCLSPSVFHLHLTPFFMFYVFMFPLMLPFISHPSFYRLFNPS